VHQYFFHQKSHLKLPEIEPKREAITWSLELCHGMLIHNLQNAKMHDLKIADI
jgi:hypothetical protein